MNGEQTTVIVGEGGTSEATDTQQTALDQATESAAEVAQAAAMVASAAAMLPENQLSNVIENLTNRMEVLFSVAENIRQMTESILSTMALLATAEQIEALAELADDKGDSEVAEELHEKQVEISEAAVIEAEEVPAAEPIVAPEIRKVASRRFI